MGRKVTQTQEANAHGKPAANGYLPPLLAEIVKPEKAASPSGKTQLYAGTSSPTAGKPPFVELAGAMLFASLLAAVGSLALATLLSDGDWPSLARTFFPSIACSWMILAACKSWTTPADDSVSRRLTLLNVGLLVGMLSMWLDGFPLPWPHAADEGIEQSLPMLGRYLGYYGLLFLLVRWWKLTSNCIGRIASVSRP